MKETELKNYKRDGKTLNPPLAQISTTNSSWINERLPGMIWAALVISSLERQEAIKFFHHSFTYLEGNKDLHDITLTGIGQFPLEHKTNFINHVLSYNKDIPEILRPLLLFDSLPGIEIWKNAIKQTTIASEDWASLGNAVIICLSHQSQEATDCRWVKVAAQLISGSLHVPANMAKELLFYPNEGDQAKVRAMIRATEIVPRPDHAKSDWPNLFWNECYEKTDCSPEQTVNKKIDSKYEALEKELEEIRKYLSDQTVEIRNALISQFFESSSSSGIDSKHDTVFGLALYGIGIFIENILYRTALMVNGRIMLRCLLETYITLSYLMKKEREDPRVWDDYRAYGSGQANLIYRKFEDNNLTASTVDREIINEIANEDRWVEFVPINLGHWDSSDLRKMCEYIEQKDLYDKYYSYTSGFVHANWAAVRESLFQKCLNPLHRLHKIPAFGLPLMTSVTDDMIGISNNILDLVSVAYPTFDIRLTMPKKESKDESGTDPCDTFA